MVRAIALAAKYAGNMDERVMCFSQEGHFVLDVPLFTHVFIQRTSLNLS